MILFIPNFLFDSKDFYFAFNWKPKVKPKKFFFYYRGDDYILIDFWKFRILSKDHPYKEITNES